MATKKPTTKWINVTCPTCRGTGMRGPRVCGLCKGKQTIKVPPEEQDLERKTK